MAEAQTGSETTKAGGPDPKAGSLGRAIDAVGIVFSLGIVASAAILIYEIVRRYFFNAPTIWVHETAIFINACAFVFGGLYVAARNQHIRVVLIYDAVPARARRWLDAAISAACLIATCFFAWAAWKVVQRALWTPQGDFRLETSGSAWNPPTPGLLKLFLFVVLIVMAVQFLVLTVNYLRSTRR